MIEISKEDLYRIWTALEYTRATISSANQVECKDKPEWIGIHKGRSYQSKAYLDNALKIIDKLKEENKDG